MRRFFESRQRVFMNPLHPACVLQSVQHVQDGADYSSPFSFSQL